ncbi:MAG TPA: GMC oxidoreductase [Casimicrobiaceae bacterium]
MTRIVVVGAGVAAAHAALTILERGSDVELWDVGREETSYPSGDFQALKQLRDAAGFFLGPHLEGLLPPASKELHRYPVSRRFLASPDDPLWSFVGDGFEAQASFAKGGFANGWGANALAFDEDDLRDWPVSAAEMDAAYRTVFGRIPVAGPRDDDLSPYLAGVYPSQPPVELTPRDRRLVASYEGVKRSLASLGVRIGRARLAVVTDLARPDACRYCDRCLWGCPTASIYNPRTSTLAACETRAGFRYLRGRLVLSLLVRDGRVTGIRYLDTATDQIREEPCDAVFLAAGALQTGAIFLRTLKASRPDLADRTDGLMDTTVVRIPYLLLRGIGQPAETRSFQFNRLIAAVIAEGGSWPRYLHAELLHLTSLLYYPLIEHMPFDSKLSKKLFFALRSALGAATFFFPDRIVPGNHQALVERPGRWDAVELRYRESADKEAHIRKSLTAGRHALRRLGCLPRTAVRSIPGAGIHYAGTVPMGEGPRRCDATGRSNLYANLYIADGAAFPSLPSKSITISLAAHATRIARTAAL